MDTSIYEGLSEGFGMAPEADVLELQKALEAGIATTPGTQVGGGALRTESLEQSLKVLTWQARHVAFWRDIPKTRAFSTVEEYTELSAYGAEGQAFNLEGELPAEVDSTYQRQARFVKFLGTTRVVSHPMAQVRTQVGDVIARENQNGILYLLRELDRTLFFGNSALGVAGAEYVEFNGLQQQVAAANIIDLAGSSLTERDIRNGSQTILDNYGVVSHLFASPRVLEDYAKEYIPGERIVLPAAQGGFTGGFVVNRVQTAAGDLDLRGDIFLRRNSSPGPSATARGSAPPAPAPATVAGVLAGAEAGNNYWAKSGVQVTSILYRASYGGARGESTFATSGAVAVVAADNDRPITVTVTNPGAFTTNPSFIYLYRSDNGGPYGLIARVAATTIAGGGTTVFTDRNLVIPDTYEAFMGEMTPDVIEFRQLLDLLRMELAIIGPAYRWMLLLYGVPVLYAPLKWIRFRNIGLAT